MDLKITSTQEERSAETDRVMALLSDTPGILRGTQQHRGNRLEELHPVSAALPASSPVLGLRGMNCVIGGASRGIGHGMAVRFAMAGANVAVLGRSDGSVSTGPGTLHDVVRQIDQVGGRGLAVPCDLTKQEQIEAAVGRIVEEFGELDVVVNNASALFPVGLLAVDEKRYDLMNSVCGRGAYLLTRSCLTHMRHGLNAHVLTVAPAPIPDAAWLGLFTAYGSTKIVMSVLNLAWSKEFPTVRFNSIWPAFTVATYAVSNNAGVNLDHTVTVAHMADPAYRMVTSWNHGLWMTDVGVLQCMRVAGYPKQYQVRPDATLAEDFMVVPEGLQAGQFLGYTAIPPADTTGTLRGKRLFIVGRCARTEALMVRATAEGAEARLVDFKWAPFEVAAVTEGIRALDLVYVSYPEVAAEVQALGTLATDEHGWMRLFEPACKSFFFFAQRVIPLLQRSPSPQLVVEAPAPVFHPDNFEPSVPYMAVAYIRSMHTIGIGAEFASLPVNAIWPASGTQLSLDASLHVLVHAAPVTGRFYAEDLAAMPPPREMPRDYSSGVSFFDFTSMWYGDVVGVGG